MAVCDIDGSFTNDIKFKEMEEEKSYIRAIMGLKNHQISAFDNAFDDQNEDLYAGYKENFIEDIRQSFMYMISSPHTTNAMQSWPSFNTLRLMARGKSCRWFKPTRCGLLTATTS